MTKTVQLFEAVKTADGDYQCQPISAAAFDGPVEATVSDAAASAAADPNGADPSAADPTAQPMFFIDSNIMQSIWPDWAAEAQAVFLQSLHSNALGGHTPYFQEVHARFEQMRQSLQQQLDQYSRYG
ncbi:hypothetical protein [Rheinheimera riviphila]|nr:hypothetical protein [Rheinheimera riviphila]